MTHGAPITSQHDDDVTELVDDDSTPLKHQLLIEALLHHQASNNRLTLLGQYNVFLFGKGIQASWTKINDKECETTQGSYELCGPL